MVFLVKFIVEIRIEDVETANLDSSAGNPLSQETGTEAREVEVVTLDSSTDAGEFSDAAAEAASTTGFDCGPSRPLGLWWPVFKRVIGQIMGEERPAEDISMTAQQRKYTCFFCV